MKLGSNILLGFLFTLWLTGTCYGFWHFEGQYLRPVPRPNGAAISRPELLPPPAVSMLQAASGSIDLVGAHQVTVLNFWNPRCPCSRYAETDVKNLVAEYQPRGVRFITVIAAGPSDSDVQDAYSAWAARHISGTLPVADRDNQYAMKIGVWAAPAAVILDKQGRIEYVGAYNVARYCSNPDTAWAAKALSAIVCGKKPPRSKTLFFGCQLRSSES